MNSLVALPIAGAVPIAAPSIASEQYSFDAAAALARAEQMIEIFRTSYVIFGWNVFEPAAEAFLDYFRRRARGEQEGEAEFQRVVDFCEAHGQSLDWLMRGDPRGLICSAAELRAHKRGEADVSLANMGEQYDSKVYRYRYFANRVREIHEQITSAAVEELKGRIPEERKAWTRGDAHLFGNTMRRFEDEIGGEEYKWLTTAQDEALPSDELHKAIMRAPTRSLVGFAVKARVLAETFSQAWDEPADDLDWQPLMVRMLVESIFEAAGEQTVEEWLDIQAAASTELVA